jgi:Holliday junction resolvasome RuvABC endonuclease subunit
MGQSIKVVGLDPSLRNWGMAIGTYDTETKKLNISVVSTSCPVLSDAKQSRVNSLDLESARQHFNEIFADCREADAVFVEVPVGSQSARAMASYGICVGILGALKGMGIPFYEVTPTEVKMISVGNKKAAKAEMIKWAKDKNPEAPWSSSAAKAEHQADALGAIYAGINLTSFQQQLKLFNSERNK